MSARTHTHCACRSDVFSSDFVIILLYLITVSISILETRAFKMRNWSGLKRFGPSLAITGIHLVLAIVLTITVAGLNRGWRDSGRGYNGRWSDTTHALYCLQKLSCVGNFIGGRWVIRRMSNPAMYNTAMDVTFSG
eukprot:m.242240 g.242240  ORF g.242240 m.242240 type:complete len:136 (+) comp33792_c1_seq2:86-493(+)